MDTDQLQSFVSASAGAEEQTQVTASSSRPTSATSTATERPQVSLQDGSSFPRKPPSVDSNFSSVQGKTAGTPPNQETDIEIDETVSTIWDDSVTDQTPPATAPLAQRDATASQQPSTAAPSRPDWMTDDLDESWPEEEQAGPSTPTPANPVATDIVEPAASSSAEVSKRPNSPARPISSQLLFATPSVSSRPPILAAVTNALPDPAFSAARHQARRALLKGRSSTAGAPTPRAVGLTTALTAGPTTPSLRLPSHQNRHHRVRIEDKENDGGDSTIWSESESDSESDAGSAPDDFASARGSLAENSRITNMQTAQQSRTEPQPQARSPSGVSDASGAKGTFIHKADADSLPPILRPVWQSPAKGQKKNMTVLGGDMFTPMRLQTMFKTPTPPEKPVQNIMSALAAQVTPFTVPDAPIGEGSEAAPEVVNDTAKQSDPTRTEAQATPSADEVPPQATASPRPMSVALPSTPFTFHSPHAPLQTTLQVNRALVPSQSLHNMQSLHPQSLHANVLARPASAAADPGLQSPAIPASASNLLSGPPTPHTPMRLFKFNYDDAVTRAKLEQMVNSRTPAPAQQAPTAGDVERERKRLRLDVKPRKVLTGDLMEMPTLGAAASSQSKLETLQRSTQQPVVDYVKESTDFMSALQDAVRVRSAGGDTSPEWATEEEETSGSGAQNRDQVSFHQGKADMSGVSALSPARQRRGAGNSPRHRPSQPRPAREDVIPSAVEHGSPQRLSSRRLPPDSSFITESSSHDIPMSSTLKSRASLSRRIAAQVQAGESPRKLLRRISAAAIAEDEVAREFAGQEEQTGKAWGPVKPTDEAIAHREQQIRQLEERIARRRQLYTPAKARAETAAAAEPQTVQRPQLITLHEPTLDVISKQRRQEASDASDAESDIDSFDMQGQQGGNTRRFQDGIVLYDSERIPDLPQPDPSRRLRNIASAVELRNREADLASLARAASLLALPTQPNAAGEGMDAPVKRGDRTASSNTLVDPSVARTVSGDVAAQLTLSDLGGKGATITRTGSLFNISQIPEQEVESLGRGRLVYNKELHRWEKMPRSRSSQEDLRSAAGSRNEGVEAGNFVPTSKTPIPAIPEASAELSHSQDVFSESPEEQQIRAQAGVRSNSFQQRLENLSSSNLSAADGRASDSSDPFRDFESFGQSSHAPASASEMADEDDESTPRPVKSQMFVSSRQQYGANPATAEAGLVQGQSSQRNGSSRALPAPVAGGAQQRSTGPSALAPRAMPVNTVPRSSSSLRNVVTYSPDSTVSSQQATAEQHAPEVHDQFAEQLAESPPRNNLRVDTQAGTNMRAREIARLHATPDRRLPNPNFGSATPRASTSSISTPKSILKQPAAFRANGAPIIASDSSAGGGTPNRTISFADPPLTSRARNLGLAPSARGNGATVRARTTLDADGDDDDTIVEDGRTQAISSALKVLADLTLGDDSAVAGAGALTTSKMRDLDANRSHWSYRTLRRPRKTRHGGDEDGDGSWLRDDETYDELHGYPDMTLLTDASFNFAHDKILEAITDVEPWEPGWDELPAINLSHRRLESCVRLKEFLPALEEVDLRDNQLSYLTGIPASVRILNVGQNRLTSMASFGHLLHLEELDISGNQIDSLSHFSCLKHLHTLKADDNRITSLEGIDKIRSLVNVSLSNNKLRGINLATTEWAGLETLDLSHNQLISVRGLALMRRLKWLNLDHNELNMVDLSPIMPRLRVLRVSGNVHLQSLDVAPAKRLRTLYADYCDLDLIDNLDQLEHLDNLSMRQQAEAAIVWPANQLRDVRRLFLSGNAFPQGISTTVAIADVRKPTVPALGAQPALTQPLRFLNLVYLELSACQLMHLPEDLAEMAPNLRSLNLDHNLISTLPSLAGMQRLKRLSVVGCRIKKSKSLITAVRGLPELQVVDSRTNPCTLGLYAPLIAPSATPTHRNGSLEGEDGGAEVDPLDAPWLPPVPNAQIVQPDLVAKQSRRDAQAQREELELLEKSHFHRRRPPLADYAVDPNTTIAKDAIEKEMVKGASYSSLFQAADARFVKTLPKQFYERRVLHRGLLAMACAKLDWVDGLAVGEEEVEEADELVQSHRFDRAPTTAA